MTRLAASVLAASLALTVHAAVALPDLDASRNVAGLRFYPDHERAALFYYAPRDLVLAREADGTPGLHFLQMRYVGTALYGNEGERGSYSTLTLRIRMDGPTPQQLDAARSEIRRLAGRLGVELRPLPITRFEAFLVYVPLAEAEAADVVSGGHFEAEESAPSLSGPTGYWSERVFTVAMDSHTSQLLWKLVQQGDVAVSVTYAFVTSGIASNQRPDVKVSGSNQELADEMLEALSSSGLPMPPERRKGVGERLAEQIRKRGVFGKVKDPESEKKKGDADPGSEAKAPEPVTRVVHAGATGIRIEPGRWPQLFERIDFNEQAPPGYAALKVYCYDFTDKLRPDLFYKKVEIEAVAVSGRRVPLEAKFLNSQPDLYARTVRFPVAVYVDRPFRYRVIGARRDGTLEVGDWLERAEWSPILDITAGPSSDSSGGSEGG